MSLYSRIALGLSLFLIAAGLVYALTAHEYVGALLLVLASACFAYIGLYVRRTVRSAAREAHADAPPEEEPHVTPTIWPFVFSLAAVGLALGAVVNRWLLVVGVPLFLAAAVGWFTDITRQWAHGRQEEPTHH